MINNNEFALLDQYLREYLLIGIACYLFLPIAKSCIALIFNYLYVNLLTYKHRDSSDRGDK